VPRALTTIVLEPELVVLVELPLVVVVVLVVLVVVEPLPQVKFAVPAPTQCVYQLLLDTDILALPELPLQPSTITTQ
jgi:hypothetical protein